MEVSFIGGLIGNSCFLQKESLDGSTSQMMESREGKREKIATKPLHRIQEGLCCSETN